MARIPHLRNAAAWSALLLAMLAARVAGETFSGCLFDKNPLNVKLVSSLKTGSWVGTSSVEVLDYDKAGKLTAVIEARVSSSSPLALLIVNNADPANPVIHRRINVSTTAGEADVGTPNSVSIYDGYAAVSLDGVPYTADGVVRIYHLASGTLVGQARLSGCAMPDSLRWTPDGKRLVVACEGEPATQATTGSDPRVEPNPAGAIGIVSVKWGPSYTPVGGCATLRNAQLTSKALSFQPFIDRLSRSQYAKLLDQGLRIDPRLTKETAAKDIEPEYVAMDDRGRTAWVTLQENNAVAVVSLVAGKERITAIWPLGRKDWSRFKLDPSDTDGPTPRLRSYANVYSWYQPDTIVYTTIGGEAYLVMANEGDSKEEALRVKALKLDPTAFPNAAALQADNELGRLTVDPLSGVKGGYNTSESYNTQASYSALYAYGARSWSIISAKTGKYVYESGDDIESILAKHPVASKCFNCDRDANVVDTRSDNAGPEPEGLEVFKRGSKTYAVVGLERMGGFLLYDISRPSEPVFGGYVYNRAFDPALGSNTAALGDLAPEGIKYVAAKDSPSGKDLLLLSNEVSATVATWELSNCPA